MPLFQKPAIGLDISDRSIEAVFIVKKGSRPTLASYGRQVLPPGLVTDGVILKPDELGLVLRKLLADQMTPPLPPGKCRAVFSLPETRVFSHVFDVPRAVDDAELAKTLAVEADSYIPYNHSEMISGQTVIEDQPDRKQVYFAAIQRETFDGYRRLFAVADIEVAVTEGEATSMARAIFRPDEPEPTVLADIGARVTTLLVFDRHGVRFSETLPTAGDAFTAAIARATGVPTEKAEEIKRTQGFSGDLEASARAALTAEVDSLVADIRRAAVFYETRAGRHAKLVLLCGGSVLLPGLLEYVLGRLAEDANPLEVRVADPLHGVDIDPALEKQGLRGLGVLLPTAIGLGLRGAGVSKFLEIDFFKSAGTIVAPATHDKGQDEKKPVATGSMPRTMRYPKFLLPAAVTLGITLMTLGVWAAVFKLKPWLSGSRAAATSATGPVTSDVSLNFTLGPGATELDSRHLQASYLTATTEVEQVLPHAATATAGMAGGRLHIVNDGPATQALVPTTRLLSAGGVLFRLSERVSVPAHGSVEATVAADKPGATGDVGPGRWTIPGLPKVQQARVYGVSDAAMAGGSALQGEPVTEAELAKAKEALGASVLEKLRGQAVAQATEGQRFLEGLFQITNIEVKAGPTVGQPSQDYTLKVKVTGTAPAYSEAELRKLVEAAALGSLDGAAGEVDSVGPLEPEVLSYDLTEGVAELRVRTTVIFKSSGVPPSPGS